MYLSPAPLYHSAPIGFCTAVQSLGGTVVMMERFDALEALQALEKYAVTHSQWVPTMFSRISNDNSIAISSDTSSTMNGGVSSNS